MLTAKLQELKKNWQREEVRSISRRYFISNGFDGTLTAIGVTVGSYLSGVENGFTVFTVGVGAMIGLATSGVWSVWEIEKAEKLAEIHKIEDAMLEELEGTEIQKQKQEGRLINSLMSGLGPVVVISSIISPFIFWELLGLLNATLLSVAIGTLLLFGFGSYMGRISGRKWYYAGLRMGLAGIVVALLNILLPG